MDYVRVLLLCSSVVAGGCFNPPEATDDEEGSSGTQAGATDATSNVATSDGQTSDDPPATGDGDSGSTTGSTSSADDPTTADDTTETGPAQGCRVDGTCVAVPAGWTGPVEVVDPEQGDCSARFGSAFDLQTELFAPDGTCGCTCGSLTADCGDVTVLQGPPAACVGATGVDTPGPGVCTSVAQGHICGRGVFADPASSPSCPAQPSVTIPELSWGGSLRVCEGELTDLGCDAGEQCFPEGAGSQLGSACIYQEGDVACPTAFPLRMFGAEDVDDQRGCATCTCNAPAASDVICETQLHIFDDGSCSNETSEITVSGTGLSADAFGASTPMSVEWEAPDVAGPSCTASSVFPTGEAVLVQPTTVCCMP
ncbi:MAG: hypothetical protein AAF799_27620 [Myxococcota bacterium]